MGRNNKKKQGTTRHEKDLISKELAGQLAEELDVTGQESEEKAVKWVQEVGQAEVKEEDKGHLSTISMVFFAGIIDQISSVTKGING